MTHLRHPGLVTTWKLKIDSKHYVEVFIWNDHESMFAADRFNRSFFDDSAKLRTNFSGQATARTITHYRPDGYSKKLIPRKFGEIFLVNDNYGVGVVTHEVFHIVSYWADAHNWDVLDRDNERFARLTGKLNSQFYKAHWKHFPDD